MNKITDERLREIVQNTYCCLDEGGELAAELLAARAEVERLTMGATKHRQTEATYLVVRDENTRLRADLRDALELIAQVDDGQVPHEAWLDSRADLLAKHISL